MHFVPQDNVYVYFRYTDKETVMVVLNNSEKDQTIDLKRFMEGIKDFTKGKDIISGKEINLNNKLEIKAKSSLILELK